MKVCVVGNSHIAAMHLGWKRVSAAYPHMQFAFYGAPNRDMSGVEFRDSTLFATEQKVAENFMLTGGSDRISLADYDAVVMVGCRIGLTRYHRDLGQTRLYHGRSARPGGDRSKREKSAAAPPAGVRQSFLQALRDRLSRLLPAYGAENTHDRMAEAIDRETGSVPRTKSNGKIKFSIVSSNFMSRAIERMVRQSRLYDFAGKISSTAGIPVFFVASPHASRHSLVRDPDNRLAETVKQGWNGPFAEIFWGGLEAALEGKAIVVRQPQETVVDHVFTKEEYSLTRKATRAGTEAVELIDDVHMNAAYGEIVMRDLVALVDVTIGARAASNAAFA